MRVSVCVNIYKMVERWEQDSLYVNIIVQGSATYKVDF